MALTLKELFVRIRTDNSGFNKGIKDVKNQTNALSNQFKQLRNQILSTFGVLAGARLFGESLKSVAKFQNEMANVSTIVDTTSKSMKDLEQGILNMAGELGSATELTRGLYQAISAGIPRDNALEFMKTAAKFAKAGLVDMFDAVDVLTTVLNAYNMETKEAGRVSDILFKTIEKGKITGQELASSLGFVIPAAATMGVKIDEVSAAVATLTKVGQNSSLSVVGLNQALISLIKPSEQAKDAAKALGISLGKEGLQKAGGLQPFLADVKEKLSNVSTELIAKLFPNVRALRAVLSLAGNQAELFATTLQQVRDSGNAVNVAFEKQQETLANTFQALKNEFQAAFIKTMLPYFEKIAKWIKENKDSLKTVFEGIVKVFEKVVKYAGLAVSALQHMGNTLKDNKSIIGKFLGTIAYGLEKAGIALEYWDQEIQNIRKEGDYFENARVQIERFYNFVKLLTPKELKALNDAMGGLPEKFKDGNEAAEYFQKTMKNISAGNFGNELAAQWQAYTGALNITSEETKAASIKVDEAKKKAEEAARKAEEAAAAYRKWREEVKEFSKSMGILSDREIVDLNHEIQVMSQSIVENSATIGKSSDTFKKYQKAVDDMIATFEAAGREVPKNLVNLKTKLALLNDGFDDLKFEMKDVYQVADKILNPTARQTANEIDEWAKGVDKLKKLEEELAPVIGKTTQKTMEGEKPAKDLKAAIKELNEATEIAVNAASQFIDVLEGLGIVSGNAVDGLRSMVGGIGGIVKGFGQIAGAGKGALGFFQKLGGWVGIGASAIGVLGGLFKAIKGKSGELKAAERRIAGIAGTTQDWAKKIEELAKEMGGADSAGRAFNKLLADIIRDSASTDKNFDTLIRKTREVISTFEQGNATAEETAVNFGAAFTEMVNMARDLGRLGGAEITGLMLLAEEFGIQTKEIADYMDAETARGAEAAKKRLELMDASTITKEIEELKSSMMGMDISSEEFAKAAEKMRELGGKLQDITKLQEIFGGKTNQTFQDIIDFENKIAENQGIVEAIKSWGVELETLSNTRRLTAQEFQDFMSTAVDSFNLLQDEGFTAAQSLEILKPQLERLAFLEQEFGYEIDDATKALIDQGVEQGIISKDFKSDSDRMIGAIEGMTGEIRRLVDVLTGDLSTGIEGIGNKFKGVTDGMRSDLNSFSKGLSGVAAQMNGEVANAIKNMGAQHDDVMTGHSIIPDVKEWKDRLKEVGEEIKTKTAKAIDLMAAGHDEAAENMLNEVRDLKEEYDELEKAIKNADKATTKTGIEDTEGLNVVNVDKSFDILKNSGQKLYDALKDNNGELAQEIIESSKKAENGLKSLFQAMIDGGQAGSRAFLDLIKKNQELKNGLSEISNFVENSLNQGFEGFKKLSEILDTTEIQKNINELQDKITKEETGNEEQISSIKEKNTKRIADIRASMARKIAQIEGKQYNSEQERLAAEAAIIRIREDGEKAIRAVIAGEKADIEAIKEAGKENLGDAKTQLEELKAKFAEVSGLQEIFAGSNIKIFEDMMAYENRVAKNQSLIDAIKAWEQEFLGFSDVTALTQDQMDQFSSVTQKSFDALIKKGFSTEQALKILGPQLQRLAMLQGDFSNLSVDENMKSLIEKAVKSGAIKLTDTTEGGFQVLNGELIAVGQTISDDLSGTITDFETLFASSLQSMSGEISTFNVNLNSIADNIRENIGGALNDLAALSVPVADLSNGISIPTVTAGRVAAFASQGQNQEESKALSGGTVEVNINELNLTSRRVADLLIAAIKSNEANIKTYLGLT